jgi:hypothetical protein
MRLLSSMVQPRTLLKVVIHQQYGMAIDNMRTARGSGRVAALAECRLAFNARLCLLQQPNFRCTCIEARHVYSMRWPQCNHLVIQ